MLPLLPRFAPTEPMTSACSAGAARTGGSLAGPSASRSVEAVAVSGTKGGLWSSLLDHLLNQAPPPLDRSTPFAWSSLQPSKGGPGRVLVFSAADRNTAR